MQTETLPPDWRMVTFGEMAFHIADRVDDPKSAGVEIYVGLEHLDPGSLRIKRWGTPDDVGATKLRVKPGQIIFGKRRAYQRKVAVSHFDGICSAHAMVLEANLEATAPGFLGFFMQSDLFFDTALAISEGSLSPTIKWKTLAAQQFPLPPRARQQEMVELFQALEEAIAATEESLAAAEELKRALLRELLTRGIGHSEFKQTEIGPVPVAWEVVTLGDVSMFVTSGSRGWAKYYSETGAAFIRIGNLTRHTIEINWADLQRVEPPVSAEGERTRLLAGDILMSITADLGMVAVTPADVEEAYINQHIALIRPAHTEVLSNFVAYWLSSECGQMQVQAFNDASIKAGMNLTNVRSIILPKPSLQEQADISDALVSLDIQRERLIEHKTHLASLKAQAINRLLTGQHDAARAGVEAAIV
jgi:type I restriction enzyme S subunit